MRKPEQTPEPSIEEILASIRRIIADDAPAAAVTADAIEPVAQQQPTPSADRRTRPGEPVARLVEDDVLELTEDFMLAEEGAAMLLQEPEEPVALTGDPYAARGNEDFYGDSYSEPDASEQYDQTTAAAAPQENVDEKSSGGLFSAVMAEVQLFGGGGTVEQAPAEPNASADTWGQPDLEALTPSPAPRTSSRPVWSQRHTEGGDVAKSAEEPAPARAAPADPRKPSFSNRDNWSQGVQMPVPDGGPATPFPNDEPVVQADTAQTQQAAPFLVEPAAEAAPAAEPIVEAEADAGPSVGQAMEDAAAAMPPSAPRILPEGLQTMAEELAERAVADFANDRLSTPPAADILKADKPFMDAITNTLADALTRGGEEADDFDDAPPPEDLIEESFGAGRPPVDFGAQSVTPAKQDRMAMPNIMNRDGGFLSARPIAAKDVESGSVDQETPELPREDIDDIVPAVSAERTESPAYRPTGIAEPFMHNVPTAPGRAAATRPLSGLGAARETVATAERIQSVASTGPRTLEDTVREMLKPLLIQWLDENMPRIVNDAIREEIAANGLLPRAGGSRR